jgi:hypothetical protein
MGHGSDPEWNTGDDDDENGEKKKLEKTMAMVADVVRKRSRCS